MQRQRRSVRQVRELIAEPKRALAEPKYWREPVCRRWLRHVTDTALFNPTEALPLAVIGVRLALRVVRRQERRWIRYRCCLALAYGVLGSTYRAAGKLDKASRALAKALKNARRCPDNDVQSDVLRREAILRGQLARQPAGTVDPAGHRRAIHLVNAAVSTASGSQAEARARINRGMLLLYVGDAVSAVHDARWALDKVDAEDRPYDQVAALSLLINALIEGDQADRDEAAHHLENLRVALPPRCPAVRGRLLWAEALLCFHNRRRKGRTRNLLNQARKKFIRLKMHTEAAAVTAELARHAPEGAVARLCPDLLPILESGPVRDLVERLREARVVERVDLAERLRRMVQCPGILPATA
ncbi:MAG: hypothetical protein GY835_03980 [bacterium]|nr:hypothetical protein [bacterium]